MQVLEEIGHLSKKIEFFLIRRLTDKILTVECPALDAGIAQLVEHDLAKVGVASSNLVSRSRFFLE